MKIISAGKGLGNQRLQQGLVTVSTGAAFLVGDVVINQNSK